MSRLFGPKPTPEAPKEPEKKVDAPPASLTRDEVKTLVTEAVGGVAQQLTTVVGQLGEKVQELAARQPQVVVQPAGPAAPVTGRNISDEEIDQAVLSGQGAAGRIRALVDRAVTEATDRVVREHVAPLREFGVNTLAAQAAEIAAPKMPHYVKFKREIDARLAILDPSVKANPAVLKMVHDAVVGEHIDLLRREAVEEAARQAQERANNPTGGAPSATPGNGAGRPEREAPEVPNVETVGGSDGVAALAHKGQGGQSQDQFAQSMGYKDWSDYMKQYDALLKQEAAGNA